MSEQIALFGPATWRALVDKGLTSQALAAAGDGRLSEFMSYHSIPFEDGDDGDDEGDIL